MVIGIVARPRSEKYFMVDDTIRRKLLKYNVNIIGILPPGDINYLEKEIPKLSEEEKENIYNTLKLCDGIILQGGNRWYEYDEVITKYIIENNIPSLFICMSMQLLNYVSSNGKYTNEQIGGHNLDTDTHIVNIKEDSILYKIIGKNKIHVNSYHNYAIKDTSLNVDAVSPDGVIEAISLNDNIIGVQWHPEKLEDDKLFEYLITVIEK